MRDMAAPITSARAVKTSSIAVLVNRRLSVPVSNREGSARMNELGYGTVADNELRVITRFSKSLNHRNVKTYLL
jgi:hypothetical protein